MPLNHLFRGRKFTVFKTARTPHDTWVGMSSSGLAVIAAQFHGAIAAGPGAFAYFVIRLIPRLLQNPKVLVGYDAEVV